ncbi:hypothetical protein WMY93_021555 [Mugilogobius chulae]|uniref:Protein kinase domain-containing protein n=1 Tax=Mugilogobius chulae TaxID=88201 RepID=A0AAW0NE84_9GOBI
METVGKFEFSRKDLVGHGAFAVVFKGRHKEELKHENIVALLDFQETASSVYLVMEYCNGGDLADYLHSKGTLSEDTIRVFLQQIAGAMRVLQAKGIIHRDLKPRTSCCPTRRDASLTATTPASRSAPEVIMSQSYDAKADLWSIGTIVFQCLTGKAPFQASSPQELRLFYEKNNHLTPKVPFELTLLFSFVQHSRETSSHLRHLLLGLLQRNHKDRMDYDEFFIHPFLEASSSIKKTTPTVTMTCFPSSASASSCSSSSTSHLASPPQSLADGQQVRTKALASPTQDTHTGFLLKDSSGGAASSSKNSSSCDTDDFVMVPAHFNTAGDLTCESKVLQDSLMNSGSLLASAGLCSKTPPHSPSYSGSPSPVSNYGNQGHSLPIPVPTQVHNYQRMEQNLQCPRQDSSPRSSAPVRRCSSNTSLGFGRQGPSPPYGQQLCPQTDASLWVEPGPSSSPHKIYCAVAVVQRISSSLIGSYISSSLAAPPPPHTDLRLTAQQQQQTQTGLGSRLHSAPCLLECAGAGGRQKIRKQHSDPVAVPPSGLMTVRPLHSSPGSVNSCSAAPSPPSWALHPGRSLLSRFGDGSPSSNRTVPAEPQPSHCTHRTHDTTAGFGRSQSAGRLSDVLLMAAFGSNPPVTDRGSSENISSEKAIDIIAGAHRHSSEPAFHSGLRSLSGGGGSDSGQPSAAPGRPSASPLPASLSPASPLPASLSPASPCQHQQHSLVADQISSLSREWSYAEQLVLYLKSADLLSAALHTAKERVKEGKLYPSTTVKQVVKKLNELYKTSVCACRTLSTRLEHFFSRKHRLMDQISSITAERLLFSHTVQMVQAAALDEMFHQGEASILRYHKLCKECIERRLTALQSGLCV